MPELPEVERARKLIQDTCKGYKIKSVDSTEDKIVYTGGTDHEEFAKEITGRTITGCERKGKTFWITLSGKGRYPVMHFGMTGMLQLKGEEPTWYRRRPKESVKTWPPKLEPQKGSVGDEPVELAFIDGRRLGRLRLVPSPVTEHPPVSALGFDPVLSHPTLEEFQKLIAKKKGTTKGMIMDQAFSAGVGNWVADEVLYQARIHPSCPVNHLSEQNIQDLHYQLRAVPLKAVQVNADSRKFPEDWLFRWRWGKGVKQKRGSDRETDRKKKQKAMADSDGDGQSEVEEEDIKPKGKDFLALPDGSPATITFVEVGGRTTAVVTELQKMPEGVEIKPKISKGGKGSRGGKPIPSRSKKVKRGGSDDDESGGSSSSLSSEEEITTPVKRTARQQASDASARKKVKLQPEADPIDDHKPDTPSRSDQRGKRKSVPDSSPPVDLSFSKSKRNSSINVKVEIESLQAVNGNGDSESSHPAVTHARSNTGTARRSSATTSKNIAKSKAKAKIISQDSQDTGTSNSSTGGKSSKARAKGKARLAGATYSGSDSALSDLPSD
ncbi:formamidopyrimidine-DNA glycosylase [Kwoniella sp. CBS 9459]